jgi:hypothetical protein
MSKEYLIVNACHRLNQVLTMERKLEERSDEENGTLCL